MFKDRLVIGTRDGAFAPLVGVRSDVSVTSRVTQTGNCDSVMYQVSGALIAGTPVADFIYEESVDAEAVSADAKNGSTVAQWTPRLLTAANIEGLAAGTTIVAGAVHWDGTAITNFTIRVKDPGVATRLRYVRASGGANNTGLSARAYARGLV